MSKAKSNGYLSSKHSLLKLTQENSPSLHKQRFEGKYKAWSLMFKSKKKGCVTPKLLNMSGTYDTLVYTAKSLRGIEPASRWSKQKRERSNSKEKKNCNSKSKEIEDCENSKDFKFKTNQDAYVVIKNFLGFQNSWFFGVFDGHGPEGHKISHYVKKKLPESIISRLMKEHKSIFQVNLPLLPKVDTTELPTTQPNLEQSNGFSEAVISSVITTEIREKSLKSEDIKELLRMGILKTDASLGPNAENSGTTC
jgi:hypothetical protein